MTKSSSSLPGFWLAAFTVTGAASCGESHEPVNYQPLSLVEEMRIRNPGGAGALAFVSEAALDTTGSIYLAEWATRQVHVYDSAGRQSGSIGGPGEAEGQFSILGSMGFVADTLWVADPRLGRITLFNRDGELIRVISEPNRELEQVATQPTLAGFLPDGSRLLSIAPGALLPGAQPPRKLPFIYAAADGTTDTLFHVTVPGTFSVRLGTQVRFVHQPFDASPLIGVSRDGSWWIEVERAAGTEAPFAAVVHRVSRTQGESWTARIPLTPVPVPASLVDSIVETSTRDPEQARALRDWIEVPRYYPLVSAVSVCTSACIWLQEATRDSTARWIRLNDSGEPTGQVILPAAARVVYATADRLWVVELDDAGVPSVVRYSVLG